MNYIFYKIYELIPVKLRPVLIGILGPIKKFIAENHHLREVTVNISWGNGIKFKFHAPIKIADKAKNRGIENTLLRNSLKLLEHTDKAVIFDIGCNYGFLSSVFALSGRAKTVHAFEPHPGICASFQRTIDLNELHDKVRLYNNAVGDTSSTIDLFLYRTTSNKNLRKDAVSHRHSVEQVTLDSFCRDNEISQCDLVKIDVDGSEISVLQGAEQIIRQYRPILVVETNSNVSVITFLTALGYSVYNLSLSPVQDGIIPSNVFAVPHAVS